MTARRPKSRPARIGCVAGLLFAWACANPDGGGTKRDEDPIGGEAGLAATAGQGGSTGGAAAGGAGVDGTGGRGGQGGAAGAEPAAGGTAGQAVDMKGGTGGSPPATTGGTAGQAMADVPCSQRVYCNDFEDATARPAGSNVSAGNTLEIATDKAFSGKKALKLTAKNGSAHFKVDLASKLKNPKRIAYVRMMVFMDDTPGGKAPAHWNIVSVEGATVRGRSALGFGGDGDGAEQRSRWVYGGTGGVDCSRGQRPQTIPMKSWSCVEIKVNEDEFINYTAHVDGKELAGLSINHEFAGGICVQDGYGGIWYVPKPTSFTFGWQQWHPAARPVTVWIDDIVVDQVPIGCPKTSR